MGHNKNKGGKNKKSQLQNDMKEKRELIFKEDGQEYGQVLKMLGNGRCDVYCFDGIKRLCHIRGKLKKKIWINIGDVVLIGLRDFQENKGDIILKYSIDESRCLKIYGEIPGNIPLNEIVSLNSEHKIIDQTFEFEP
nr:eukaryotic translation initiation factor 1A [Cryptomonas curvata]